MQMPLHHVTLPLLDALPLHQGVPHVGRRAAAACACVRVAHGPPPATLEVLAHNDVMSSYYLLFPSVLDILPQNNVMTLYCTPFPGALEVHPHNDVMAL